MPLKSTSMERNVDTNKLVRQHLEMDNFFTGGFVVKGNNAGREQTGTDEPSADAAIELEKIADEVHQCRKCDLGSLRTNAVPGEGNPNARIVFVGE